MDGFWNFFGGCFGALMAMAFAGVVLVGGCIGCSMLFVSTMELPDPQVVLGDGDPVVSDIATAKPTKLTLENFKSVESGMSLSEVESLIGDHDSILSEVDIPGAPKTVIYQWKNLGGVQNANVTFQDGKVVMKAQFGL